MEVGIIRTRVAVEIVFFREVVGLDRMLVGLCDSVRVRYQIVDEPEHCLIPVGSGTQGVGASLRG